MGNAGLRTAAGARMKTGVFVGGDRPLATGESVAKGAACRPMTSVRAAGFSSSLRRGTTLGKLNVDLSGLGHGPTDVSSADLIEPKPEDCPEFQIKEMEKKVCKKIASEIDKCINAHISKNGRSGFLFILRK